MLNYISMENAILARIRSSRIKNPDELIQYLHKINYFDVPASAIEGRNYPGSLFYHSKEVVNRLTSLTYRLNLKWLEIDSPAVIGFFHDIEKCNRSINEVDNDPNNHGYRSFMIIKNYINLTEEEEYCIKYHQGAFISKDRWQEYNDAIRKYPNVLFTHTADMIQSQLTELGYSY